MFGVIRVGSAATLSGSAEVGGLGVVSGDGSRGAAIAWVPLPAGVREGVESFHAAVGDGEPRTASAASDYQCPVALRERDEPPRMHGITAWGPQYATSR